MNKDEFELLSNNEKIFVKDIVEKLLLGKVNPEEDISDITDILTINSLFEILKKRIEDGEGDIEIVICSDDSETIRYALGSAMMMHPLKKALVIFPTTPACMKRMCEMEINEKYIKEGK